MYSMFSVSLTYGSKVSVLYHSCLPVSSYCFSWNPEGGLALSWSNYFLRKLLASFFQILVLQKYSFSSWSYISSVYDYFQLLHSGPAWLLRHLKLCHALPLNHWCASQYVFPSSSISQKNYVSTWDQVDNKKVNNKIKSYFCNLIWILCPILISNIQMRIEAEWVGFRKKKSE